MHAEPASWVENADAQAPETREPTAAGATAGSGGGDALQLLVREAVETYLQDLGEVGQQQSNGHLYELLLHRVELPLLQAVLQHVQQNQTRAARILGLNRGTLRKKMQLHGLLGK